MQRERGPGARGFALALTLTLTLTLALSRQGEGTRAAAWSYGVSRNLHHPCGYDMVCRTLAA